MIDGATREDIVRWNRYQCEKENVRSIGEN